MIRLEAKLIAEAIAEVKATPSVAECAPDHEGYNRTCCAQGGRPERVADMIAEAIADKLEAIDRPRTAAIVRGESK